jgi:hypothetical protein
MAVVLLIEWATATARFTPDSKMADRLVNKQRCVQAPFAPNQR